MAGVVREAPARAPSLLVIEDEPGIVDFLRRGLEAEGFAGGGGARRRSRASASRSGELRRVVLDLMLPGRSGMEVLASLRKAKPACR